MQPPTVDAGVWKQEEPAPVIQPASGFQSNKWDVNGWPLKPKVARAGKFAVPVFVEESKQEIADIAKLVGMKAPSAFTSDDIDKLLCEPVKKK